jgi:hypothetical protein
MTDVDIFISILEEKFPDYFFDLNVKGDVVFVYGENNETVSSFCQNLSECMCKPVKRIAFIKPPSIN